VSFVEAETALLDPLSKTDLDPEHSTSEPRFVTFGLSWRRRLLAVSHTEHGPIIELQNLLLERIRSLKARVSELND
jgi:hypothetical protein